MIKIAACLLVLLGAVSASAATPALKISENKRFIVKEDNTPFFYLGDTAWELFHRLNREDASEYLKDRASKHFTVIQAVVLAEFDGLTAPNPYGQLPLIDNDPTKPNEAYFEHVDYIVNKAEELGLYVGMLPTWGDKINKKWGIGPEIFTPENAAAYGEFLGKRYKDKPIIWISGGDRPIENERHGAIYRALVKGLQKGDGGIHLITYHPMGGRSSSQWFQNDEWLAFNMLQSGHGARDIANYNMIAADYARTPVKPCLDGEANYEDHPINWKPEMGWFDDYDVRKSAYRSVFAGACGYTYGCHDIWQFLTDKFKPVSAARTPWRKAAQFPAAGQMQFLRALMESRPYLSRVPDVAILASDPGKGGAHVQATGASDGSYAFIYIPLGQAVSAHMDKLAPGGQKDEAVAASWFNPRDGSWSQIGKFSNSGIREFTPPSHGTGNDWILVLDDSSKNYK